jgi:hypothetical protein
MFEMPNHPEAEPITDAVELAFWGQDFQSKENEKYKFAPAGHEDELLSVYTREKGGYDAVRNCHVRVQQVRCVMFDEGSVEQVDMIFAVWDDGLLTAVNTVDLYTAQRVSGETDEVAPEERLSKESLIKYTVHALSQVTDITG